MARRYEYAGIRFGERWLSPPTLIFRLHDDTSSAHGRICNLESYDNVKSKHGVYERGMDRKMALQRCPASHGPTPFCRIPPSTRLRRALNLRSLPLTSRIILSNPQSPHLIRNPDPTDGNNTSLHLVAKLGLADIAGFLLAQGHEDLGISRNLDGLTPLMLAAQAGNDEENEIVRGRIQVGKIILARYPECAEIKDKQGKDAFSHAAHYGTLPLLHALLALPLPDDSNPKDAYPQLAMRDDAGNTPLHQASAAGQLKVVRLLISLGADHTARNNANWTPVDYSASVSAEVYLRGLVREREGARVMGNITAAESGAGSGSDGRGVRRDPKMAEARVRLVHSDDEGSDTGGEGKGTAEIIRGRARTAT